MVRRMFLPFFSKANGPPRLRLQVLGTKGKRFYKLVASNQRDPFKGKHMEVLGSYAPSTHSGLEEIRLRFSRVKFWLGVGAEMTPTTRMILGLAGLIPPPPPRYGWRTQGQHNLLQEVIDQQSIIRKHEICDYHKSLKQYETKDTTMTV